MAVPDADARRRAGEDLFGHGGAQARDVGRQGAEREDGAAAGHLL